MQALMHIDQLEHARVLLSPDPDGNPRLLRERGTYTEMARRLADQATLLGASGVDGLSQSSARLVLGTPN